MTSENQTDFLHADTLLTDQEKTIRERVARFATIHLLPGAAEAWETETFRSDLIPHLAQLHIAGGGINAYGCPEMSSVAYGLAVQEIAKADSSFGTFFGVHSGLAMGAIARLGYDEQKQRLLPRLASFELTAAFALTQPDHGSDAAHLSSTAVLQGDHYILNGDKRWIGHGRKADIVIVWARAEDGLAAFIVELPCEGYEATLIRGKLSKRSVENADITLRNCRIPAANRLPTGGVTTLAGILAETRHNVAWGALGEALACYEAALSYSTMRQQFGKPIASFQLVQSRLVRMATEITRSQLMLIQLGRLRDAGRMTPAMSAMAKLSCTAMAREVASLARETLGGNGILQEHGVMRHLADIESVYTVEGTFDINTLIVGRELTGIGAFD